ncbi:MAG: restriction endonuclease [Nitrospinae bacterium]|nr:restriction endonuclease [Nitrospinota bacterium]MBL7021696.1 restriction endonuclease [Nitrospinaceae bacterium]
MAKTLWVVRAGEGAHLIEIFKENSIIAIGWSDAETLANVIDRKEFIRKIREAYPEESDKWVISGASQVFRFQVEIKVGDRIVSYDPTRRIYLVGSIVGDYQYDPIHASSYPRCRSVKWEAEVSRDDLSVSSKNSLGSTLTIFHPSDTAVDEIEALATGKPKKPPEVEEVELIKDIQNQAHEFIKDKVNKLDWEEMQELVAGVLRAMGYKTQVSPAGPDQGKDIIASPDGFGFETPRIMVEVKHRKGSMGATDIRSFLGGRHKDDKGLYVSTGGFTKDAIYEAERANIPLTLMNLDKLVKAITEHYENMDLETRVLVPLKKVYWPS